MFIRKYWIPLTVFLLAIVGLGIYYLATQPEKDRIVIIKPVEVKKPIEPKPPPPGSQPEWTLAWR